MSKKQKIVDALSGTKRRPRQELHSFDEPTAKTRHRRGESDENVFGITQAENHNGKQDGSDGVWNEEQHKHFVSSIFQIGLKNSSPAIILENMTQKAEMITSERVKSKLQKYRSSKNKEKSKQEFTKSYCDFLQRIKSIQAATRPGAGFHHHHHRVVDGTPSDPILSKLLEDMGRNRRNPGNKNNLLGGDVAGYLTYSVMKENKQIKNVEGQSSANGNASTAVLTTNVLRKGAREYVENYAGCAIQFPILTKIEKKSSLGIAMTFIAGLFLTMSQHLTRERARAETIGLKLPSAASFNDTDAPDDNTAPKNM